MEDKRTKILYLGTNPSHLQREGQILHYPVIQLVPKRKDDPFILSCFEQWDAFTHIVFTSKNAVSIFWDLFHPVIKGTPWQKACFSIGKVTTAALQEYGIQPTYEAKIETQEGLMAIMKGLDLTSSFLFYPRSSRARTLLKEFLQRQSIRHVVCDLYQTVIQKREPLPDLGLIDEIVFTSPSTVEAFFAIFSYLPKEIRVTVMGSITEAALRKKYPDLQVRYLRNTSILC